MVGYNTKQKKLVLELVKSNKELQLTCDDITNLLVKNNTPVGRTTVYRQLEKLAAEGVIRKSTLRDSKSYIYQYIDESMNCGEHMHLRCTRCGKYVHLGCDFMSRVNEHIFTHHNFEVDNSHTEILGVCGNCLQKG